MQKKKDISDWQTSLDENKKHYLFLVRNSLSLIPFIRMIQLTIRKNFAFLDNYMPPKTRTNMNFPLFFMEMQREWNEYFILLPNRISVPPSSNSKADTLQDMFLFNDEQYFFNRQGQFLILCDYVDYDYVFLLLCDKDGSISDIMNPLRANRELLIQDISPLMKNLSKRRTGNLSKESDKELVFNFFGDVEVMIDDFRTSHLKCCLAPNQSIKAANIKNPDILNQRFITADLLRKEDDCL